MVIVPYAASLNFAKPRSHMKIPSKLAKCHLFSITCFVNIHNRVASSRTMMFKGFKSWWIVAGLLVCMNFTPLTIAVPIILHVSFFIYRTCMYIYN